VTLHLVERAATPSLSTYAHNALHAVGAQFLLFHPLLWPALVYFAWSSLRRARTDARFALLAWAGVPLLAFFTLMMIRVSDAEPHWTMVGYVPIVIAGAGILDAAFARQAIRRYLATSFAFSAALLALYSVHMSSPVLLRYIPSAVYVAEQDPINETLGWDQIRSSILEEQARLGKNAVVVSNHNVLCGHVQVVMGDAADVYCSSPRRTQFDFIDRARPAASVPAIYLESARYARSPALALPEHDCTLARRIEIERGGKVVNDVRLWACGASRGEEYVLR